MNLEEIKAWCDTYPPEAFYPKETLAQSKDIIRDLVARCERVQEMLADAPYDPQKMCDVLNGGSDNV